MEFYSLLIAVAKEPEVNMVSRSVNKLALVVAAKPIGVPLSPTGKEPVTHYWCGWMMDDAQAKAVIPAIIKAGGEAVASTPLRALTECCERNKLQVVQPPEEVIRGLV